jgi:hypothetical protein
MPLSSTPTRQPKSEREDQRGNHEHGNYIPDNLAGEELGFFGQHLVCSGRIIAKRVDRRCNSAWLPSPETEILSTYTACFPPCFLATNGYGFEDNTLRAMVGF